MKHTIVNIIPATTLNTVYTGTHSKGTIIPSPTEASIINTVPSKIHLFTQTLLQLLNPLIPVVGSIGFFSHMLIMVLYTPG